MFHPFLKTLLSTLSGIAYWVSFTPPNPPPTLEKHVDGIFGRFATRLSFISKIAVAMSVICQVVVIIALWYPSKSPAAEMAIYRLCPFPTTSNRESLLLRLSKLHWIFLLGCMQIVSMTILRVWCYRTLHRFFVFEIAITKSHKLITTGPYAYVRHPAYTGQILVFTGIIVITFSPGGWVAECQIMQTHTFWWMLVYVILAVYSIWNLFKRGALEDQELKRAFGSEWVGWSRRVPHMFVPGLI